VAETRTALPTYDEALALVLPHAPPLGDEAVPLREALGRVLRRDVVADRDQPPFDRSAMDGFAVKVEDVAKGGALPVVGSVAAGGAAESFQNPIAPGTARRIATGAPLPAGADAVVPIEQAVIEGAPGGGGGSEKVKFIIDKAAPFQNVHRQASDASRGQVLIRAGTRLGPQHLGIAAAVGDSELLVAERPRITLLSTGDEVVSPEVATCNLEPQQIRNSNSPMLVALLASLGAPLTHHEHVPDEPEITLAAAREALSRSHLVITIGGVSVGQRDFLPPSWKRLGLETVLHGVNIQPGKPVFVARDAGKLVLGLPGNPVSVLCTAHLFVWPLLRAMLGAGTGLPWFEVRLVGEVKASRKRQVFRAATLSADGTASVIHWHGSGDLVHTADADGFVRLPLQDEPIAAGTAVPFLPLIR
jgi:molybdopterin molybdotransferase